MGNCCSRLHELIFSGTATDRSDYSPIESFADSGRDGTAAGNSIGSYQYASSNGVNVAANGSNTTSHRNNHHNDVSNPGSLSSQIEIPTNVTISQPKSSTFHLNYELGQEIGIGSTSKCYTCTKKSTGTQYACKVIDKRHVEMKFSGLMEQFYLEIKVLKFLHHPNIIHLEDTFETSDRIYIIMERMMGGELFDYVVEKGTLSEIEASTIVRKITSAVAHMHGMNIIHRDLKPENLLLTHKGPNPEVKIIDFGLAKVVEAEQVASSFLGTKGYLAPEMLQRHSYDKAIDMWALGVIVFVLLCGCLPFDDDSSKIANESLARKKFTLRFPQWASNLSTSAKDLLHNLLDINPKTRFTAAQALNHPWVAGKTVQANSFLQSPSIMGARRNELRSPQIQQSYAARVSARASGGAATVSSTYGGNSPIRVYGGPIPPYNGGGGGGGGGGGSAAAGAGAGAKPAATGGVAKAVGKGAEHPGVRGRKNSV